MNLETPLFSTTLKSVVNFLKWLNESGQKSYDQYDFWATKYGQFSKKIYYKNMLFGIAFVSPLIILDNFFPITRKFFVPKNRFPIADAHYSQGFLNLYKLTSNKKYLDISQSFLRILIKTSIKTKSGISWGYPFDWQTFWGNYSKGTPLITTTPYCLEAFINFQKYGIKNKYNDEINLIIKSISEDFPFIDLKNNQKASNYSNNKDSNNMVINASSYKAYSLILAGLFMKDKNYFRDSNRYLNFVIDSQNSDGSWFYSCESSSSKFVDHIHTCFILKNLIKCNKILENKKVDISIRRGMKYYIENLFDEDKLPIPFSERHRFQTSARELYDFAEAINLLILHSFEKNYLLIQKIIKYLSTHMSTKNGSFLTRKTFFLIDNSIPYHRWAQSQTFKSLTEVLNKICVE